jgi:hypothetical protein
MCRDLCSSTRNNLEGQETTTAWTRRQILGRTALLGLAATGLGGIMGEPAAASGGPRSSKPPRGSAHNVRTVGYSDLDGRGGGFKMAVQEVDGRWLLYLGHLWHRGWTILDVTRPSRPEVLNFIEGPENTWTIQMELNGGKMITALEQMPESWGGDPNLPFEEGVLIWDLAEDPVHPALLGHFATGGSGTHRNFYDGGRYLHLAAGMPGYEGNIYVIVDIDDPTVPTEVGRWWVPGQHTQGGETPDQDAVSLHGPPYIVGDLAWLPYGGAGMVILDISDPAQPSEMGRLDFSPPFNANIGAHSVLPLSDRNLALVTSEAIAEDCQEPLNHTSVVDVSDPTAPLLLSTFPIPVPPRNAPYDDFCEKRGGRFGPHNFNQHYHSPFTNHSDTLTYLTYFNAGLRIYDIANPRLPREVGYFIPPDPTTRYGPIPSGDVVQSEDVLVDSRGYIYLTNKQQGLFILQGTGPARSRS